MVDQFTIIKYTKKHYHHGSHGAWKVALADFAIAMMAFFLLMWILTIASQEERKEVSGYFERPEDYQHYKDSPPTFIITSDYKEIPKELIMQREDIGMIDSKVLKEVLANQEREKMLNLKKLLEASIIESKALNPYKDQIYLDIIDEGLRVQIFDTEDRAMFERSSSLLNKFAYDILINLSEVINTVDNKVTISGHTDAQPFKKGEVTNWELSADRANAARRALIDGGLYTEKVARVIGLASTVLLEPNDPTSSVNRRISIIVLNKEANSELRAQESR